jgi:choline dehydrogenase-like flavoprotein
MSNIKESVDNYPTLSLPFDLMKEEYDVVIVGSGYGAGVAASRMARAGKSVAVLELGWERKRMSASRSVGSFSICKNSVISTLLELH